VISDGESEGITLGCDEGITEWVSLGSMLGWLDGKGNGWEDSEGFRVCAEVGIEVGAGVLFRINGKQNWHAAGQASRT